jgi:C1A family cysteine protease
MARDNRKYGGKPPKIDLRDYQLEKTFFSIPDNYTLVNLPRVKNQRQVKSCVAHAMSSILEYFEKNNTNLSTNFIYGIQKQLFNYTGTGMYLSNACKIVHKYGDMLEEDCQGNDEVPTCRKKAEDAFADEDKKEKAYTYKVKFYFNCKDADDVKRAIYKYGPVLASIKWYDDYKCNEKGVLVKTKGGKGNYGYHAIMVYGWNKDGFLCQNSWGENWGNKGRFILPYSDPFVEAKGFADADNARLIIPKNNKTLNIAYKSLNSLLNLFKT